MAIDKLKTWVQEKPLDTACSLIITELRQHLSVIRVVIMGIETGIPEASDGLERIKVRAVAMNEIINDVMLGELMPRLRELNPERSNKTE